MYSDFGGMSLTGFLARAVEKIAVQEIPSAMHLEIERRCIVITTAPRNPNLPGLDGKDLRSHAWAWPGI